MTALRSYLAGTGAASAVVGAAAVSFTLLTAIVAFEGFTIGGGGAGSDTVSISRGSATAGSDAVAVPGALAVSSAPAAVAPAAVGPAVVLTASTITGTSGGNDDPTPIVPTGTPVPDGPGAPVTVPGSPGLPGPDPVVDGGNPVDNLAAGLDQTISEATGIPSDLAAVVAPVADALDQLSTGLTGHDLEANLNELGLTTPGNGSR